MLLGFYKYVYHIIIENKILPFTYEMLIKKGWTRCGNYYYKNNLTNACCKTWNIRLNIEKFHITAEQRKTVRRMMGVFFNQKEGTTQPT